MFSLYRGGLGRERSRVCGVCQFSVKYERVGGRFGLYPSAMVGHDPGVCGLMVITIGLLFIKEIMAFQ